MSSGPVDLSTLPPAVIPIEKFLPTRPTGSYKWQYWHKGRRKRGKQKPRPAPPKKKIKAPRRKAPRLEVVAPRVLQKLPPAGTHDARRAYDWFQLQESVRAHSARGPSPRPLEGAEERGTRGNIRVPPRPSLLSGSEVKERVNALGLSGRQFASRSRIAESGVQHFFKASPGQIPGWFIRLLEFEEFMADLADLLDTPMTNPRLRHGLAALLEEQVSKML